MLWTTNHLSGTGWVHYHEINAISSSWPTNSGFDPIDGSYASGDVQTVRLKLGWQMDPMKAKHN